MAQACIHDNFYFNDSKLAHYLARLRTREPGTPRLAMFETWVLTDLEPSNVHCPAMMREGVNVPMRIRLRFEIVLVVLAFLVSLVCFVHAAQVATSSSPVTTASKPAPSDNAQPQTKTENDMLKAQLEVIRDYDQRLLATVYASLGGVFLLVVLVGGLNWFTNYRLYERERDSLRQSLQLASQEEAAKLTEVFQGFKNEVTSALSQDSQKARTAAKEAVQSFAASVRHDLAMAELHNTNFRAEYFVSRNDGYRATQEWVDYLEVLDRLGWLDEHWVGTTIGKIEAALPMANALNYSMQTKLFKLLDKAPPAVASDVARLKKAVEAKKKST